MLPAHQPITLVGTLGAGHVEPHSTLVLPLLSTPYIYNHLYYNNNNDDDAYHYMQHAQIAYSLALQLQRLWRWLQSQFRLEHHL